MKKAIKQFISLFLIIVMLVPYLVTGGVAVSSGSENFGVAHVDAYSQVAYDEKTNTFSLDLELNAELYDHYENVHNDKADRGYFTANYDGWYLVELWGGNGASGLGESGDKAGQGGKAGYVYAKVYLEKDDVLFYSLGGNGTSTYVTGEGGGGNGGGHGGTQVTYGVGGGGGYSALFLFDDAAYFERTYLDGNKNFVGENINEFDRTSKYIMIAGGGGGGGSPMNSSAQFRPDGGNGGSVDGSVMTGTVNAIGATVAGTWYAGLNGKSSGTSTQYIGHGGEDMPGEASNTAWNWVTGEKPNDWVGSQNRTRPGGAGGAGNLRGGAGGGGYAGGSGGTQQSMLIPSNIGGGGGGSSFIASTVNKENVLTGNQLSKKELELRDGVNPNMQPKSGAVSITWLPGEGSEQKFFHLPDVNVSFSLSQYFDVTGFSYSQLISTPGVDENEDGVYEVAPTYNFEYATNDDGTTDVVIQNISLRPSAENLTGNLHIHLELTPLDNFPGGNDVPLLASRYITVTSNYDPDDEGPKTPPTCSIPLSDNSYHVNVPLNFEAVSRHIVSNGSYQLDPTHLYSDHYAEVRNAIVGERDAFLVAYPMYKFISDITAYEVINNATSQPVTSTATVEETTQYTVQFSVTPTNAPDINPLVGPEIGQTTFSSISEVTILGLHEGHLNGQKLEFYKNLTYDAQSNSYIYTLNTVADNDRASHTPQQGELTGAGEFKFTAAHDGIYLIQVWGGDGGDGHTMSGVNTFSGGDGADGGYSYGYLPLKAGDYLYAGKVGTAGNKAAGSNHGGDGGVYTKLEITYSNNRTDALKGQTKVIAIAAGGGGGGSAAADGIIALFGDSGDSAEQNKAINSTLSTSNDADPYAAAYNGNPGLAGTGYILSYTGGAAGTSPASFFVADGKQAYTQSDFHHLTEDEFKIAVGLSPDPDANGVNHGVNPGPANENGERNGAIRVTCLELSNHSHVTANLSNYTIEIPFSEYFVVDEDSVSGTNNSANAQTQGKAQLKYASASLDPVTNKLTVTDIEPFQDGETSEGHYNSHINFSISVKLTPKEGFLGGYDVPVLAAKTDDFRTVASGGTIYQPVVPVVDQDPGTLDGKAVVDQNPGTLDGKAPIGVAPAADYANVRLGIVSIGTLTGREHVCQSGNTYTRSNLYTWDANGDAEGANSWVKPGDWTARFLEPVEQLTLASTGEVITGEQWTAGTKNIYYTVIVGVSSTDDPEKSTAGQFTPLLTTAAASVHVQERLIFNLSGLDCDKTLGVDHGIPLTPGEDCVIQLTPHTGYALPTSISVTYVTGGGDAPYIYDAVSGRVTILGSAANGSILLTAAGTLVEYHIYYVHEKEPGGEQITHEETYHYGDTVTAFDHEHTEVPGHTFTWRWLTHQSDGVAAYGDSLVGKKMPARDVYVIGVYKADGYTLVVDYQWDTTKVDPEDANLPALPAAYSGSYVYGQSYAIDSPTSATMPTLAGYAPHLPTVSGVVDDDLIETAVDGVITITVTYAPTANLLRIIYRYADSDKVDVYEQSYDTGATYHIDTDTVPYYIPDIEVVTGTMDADGAEFTVTYMPKDYTVNLIIPVDGGNDIVFGTRKVFYNNIYGHTFGDADADGIKDDFVYDPLPEQVSQIGKHFTGWYMTRDGSGDKVTNETAFELSHLTDGAVTLYAQFKTETFVLSVEHVFIDDTPVAETQHFNLTYGASKTVNALTDASIRDYYDAYILADEHTEGAVQIHGNYYLQTDSITVASMPAQPVDRAFIYIGKMFDLTIYYKYGEQVDDHAAGSKAADSVVRQVRYGEAWESVTSPTVKDVHNTPLKCSTPVVEGTMNQAGITVTVLYFAADIVIDVTVSWGDMDFTYNRGAWDPETHQYSAGTFDVATDHNKISVTNSNASTIPVTASFEFHRNQYFPNLSAHFTESSSNPNAQAVLSKTVAKNATESVWLWLKGRLPDTVSGNVTGGTFTVTITGGG